MATAEVKAPGGGAPLSVGAGSPLPHTAAFNTATPQAQMTVTPKRREETDLLVFDVYAKVGFTLEDLETQVRAVRIPHVSWAPSFLHMDGSPSLGINRLRVCAVLKDSSETTVIQVEQVRHYFPHPPTRPPPLTPLLLSSSSLSSPSPLPPPPPLPPPSSSSLHTPRP